MNAIEMEEKRSAGDDVRRLTTMWMQDCDCSGPQPVLGVALASEHAETCPYRRQIEAEQRAEVESEARSR
jgi:hypothetical protein